MPFKLLMEFYWQLILCKMFCEDEMKKYFIIKLLVSDFWPPYWRLFLNQFRINP